MAKLHVDPLVDAYLRRLDDAAATLPPQRRAELLADIREHIRTALLEPGAADQRDARAMLERLGPPEDIVAAAADTGGPHAMALARPRAFDVIALLVLAIGGFLVPVAGWVFGAVLVLLSGAWSARDKTVGLLGPALLLAAMGLGLAILGRGNLGPTETVVLVAAMGGGLAGPVGAAYLTARLLRTPAVEPSVRA